MNEYIDQIKSLLSKKIDDSVIVHLLSLIRKELESSNTINNSSFSVLKFYCDWCLHNRIDRSEAGSSIIRDINRTVGIMWGVPNNDVLIDSISVLLLGRFKNQLVEFFKKNLISSVITDNSPWKNFLRFLFHNLENTPVLLRSIHRQELQANPIGFGLWIEEISIMKTNFNDPSSFVQNEIFALDLLTNHTTRIRVPLTPK